MENSTNETNERLNPYCEIPSSAAFLVTPLLALETMEVMKYLHQCLLCDEPGSAGITETIEQGIDDAGKHFTENHFRK
jgi:hypothetical protein